MQVNSETGVVQDMAAIGKITRAKEIFLHVDAAQSLGKMTINLQDLPVDLMSFSAHKIYGPKGIGALYVGSHPAVRLVPQIVGGGQERKLRAGTLATHQIVGFGEACRLLSEGFTENVEDIKALSDRLWLGIKDLPGVFLNADRKYALPHFLNVRFVGWAEKGEAVSFPNLAVSAASACNTISLEPSHVLKAMGYNEDEARQSIRFSLGQFTTEAEINKAIDLIRATCLERGMI
jgi:cysteine desulfurase